MTRWLAIQFCTDIHGAWWMNPKDCGNPLTRLVVPRAGLRFHLTEKHFNINWTNSHEIL